MHTRIEKIATGQLHMQVPDASRVQVVPLTNFANSADFMKAPEP